MKEVTELLGIHKTNTTAYHPQTDGLVEQFNHILITKTSQIGGCDWDQKLPHVLFAYQASEQQSTHESPFYLLYGHDPRLPTEAALTPAKERPHAELRIYLTERLTEAWSLARTHIKKAQKQQKLAYDQHARAPKFSVFLLKPAEKTGEGRKLARAYHGTYRVVKLADNNAHIRRVDKPESDLLLVALDCLRRCPDEFLDNQFWPPDKPKEMLTQTKSREQVKPSKADLSPPPVQEGLWTGRLRKRQLGQ